MVRVAFQDCKCAIELFQQDDPGQLVSKRYLAEGNYQIGRLASFLGESISRTDAEKDILRTAVLLVAQELCKLLRAELAPALVEKNESRTGATGGFFCQLHQAGFIAHFVRFGFRIARKPLEIFSGKRLDCRFFSFSDPCNAELHRSDLYSNHAK